MIIGQCFDWIDVMIPAKDEMPTLDPSIYNITCYWTVYLHLAPDSMVVFCTKCLER